MIYLCIYSPVCSFWFRLVYSLLPRCILSMSVLPCPALMFPLNIIIWVYVLVCVFLYPPSCVHRDNNTLHTPKRVLHLFARSICNEALLFSCIYCWYRFDAWKTELPLKPSPAILRQWHFTVVKNNTCFLHCNTDVLSWDAPWWLPTLLFILGFFFGGGGGSRYYDRTDQSWQEATWERKRGAGSGKVLEPGFKLGMPVAQQHCMSTRCPQGCRHWLIILFLFSCLFVCLFVLYFLNYWCTYFHYVL